MKPAALTLFAAASLLLPLPARAVPVLEMFGPVGTGGLNARVLETGPAAAYFNPALLPAGADTFEVGFFAVRPSLSLSVQPRTGVDIASAIYKAWLNDGGAVKPLTTHPLATQDIALRQSRGDPEDVTSILALGFTKRLYRDKLVFGFYATLPAGKLQDQNAFYSDEREQYFSNSLHFEMLGDRLTMSTFGGALGMQVTPQLAIGVGVSAAIATTTGVPVYVPDGADYGSVLLDSNFSVSMSLAPVIGVVARPLSRLSIAATLHDSTAVDVSGINHVRVSNTQQKDQHLHFVQGYEPVSVAAGAGWDALETPGGGLLTLAGTLIWRQWSEYQDRHGERPLDPWDDTFSYSAGARFRQGDLSFHLDFGYVPSPVPDQIGRTNYVDNSRVEISTGFKWQRRLGATSQLHAALVIEGQRLLAREVSKNPLAPHPVLDEFPDNTVDPTVDSNQRLPEALGLQTNNPGYPGFSSSGWLIGGGLTVGLDY